MQRRCTLHSTMFHCRGYLVSWDVEKPVWWRAFKNMLQQQPQDCGLLMTEAPFCLPSIQTSTMQVTKLYIYLSCWLRPAHDRGPFCLPSIQTCTMQVTALIAAC